MFVVDMGTDIDTQFVSSLGNTENSCLDDGINFGPNV
jgi:hypothetical protein